MQMFFSNVKVDKAVLAVDLLVIFVFTLQLFPKRNVRIRESPAFLMFCTSHRSLWRKATH